MCGPVTRQAANAAIHATSQHSTFVQNCYNTTTVFFWVNHPRWSSSNGSLCYRHHSSRSDGDGSHKRNHKILSICWWFNIAGSLIGVKEWWNTFIWLLPWWTPIESQIGFIWYQDQHNYRRKTTPWYLNWRLWRIQKKFCWNKDFNMVWRTQKSV